LSLLFFCALLLDGDSDNRDNTGRKKRSNKERRRSQKRRDRQEYSPDNSVNSTNSREYCSSKTPRTAKRNIDPAPAMDANAQIRALQAQLLALQQQQAVSNSGTAGQNLAVSTAPQQQQAASNTGALGQNLAISTSQ
jgi:hypothetical protein